MRSDRRRRPAGALVLLVAAAISALAFPTAAQDALITSYTSGQSIAPAFEGWEENSDGSFNLVFGYFNRNWDEAIDLPVGPENRFEPGVPDQGQPTHFLPRRNRFIFRVRVPKDFGDKEVVWTLTSHGRTERAYGTLRPGYFMDNDVITANMGVAAGSTTLELQNLNTAPSLTLEHRGKHTVKVGEPITLAAVAKDDGLPKTRSLPPRNPLAPSGSVISSAVGLRLSWFVYRQPVPEVVFDPPQFKVYEDTRFGSPWSPGWNTPPVPPGNRWVTRATFSQPGTYVLRCMAHDGALMTFEDVTVTVTR